MTEQLIVNRRDTAAPRKPQRKNGRQKYEKLLDTLESLLTVKEASDITLADLSEAAGVPTASVYHFFPNRDAGLAALAERYFDASSSELVFSPDDGDWESWQDLIKLFCNQARTFFEASESVQKIKFGPKVNWAVRDLLIENDRNLARILCELFTREFELPSSQDWEERFLQAITICDAFWTLSYSRYGCITEEMAAEAQRAAIAYLKMYLGELLERRPSVLREPLPA